jgi:membrane dipeptidase
MRFVIFTLISLISSIGIIPAIPFDDASAIAYFPPPLKQILDGVVPENVTCTEGLVIALKALDNSPVCLKPTSIEKLIQRGWAIEKEAIVIDDTVQDDFKFIKDDGSVATEQEIAERVEYLVKISDPRTDEERAKDVVYREKYGDAIIIDSVVIGTQGVVGHTFDDVANLASHYKEGAYTAFGTTTTNGDEGAAPVFERLDNFRIWIEENNEEYQIISSVNDLHDVKKNGKAGFIINSQSSDMLDGELVNVQKFYDAGIRQLNFAYNVDNMWAAGMNSNNQENVGLTELGEQLVIEMNKVGMLVDCSHSSDQACIDAARVTTKPMVLSHSNPRALLDNIRNSNDEAIKAVASTGGVICTNYIGSFLNEEGDASPKAISKHVDYVKQLVGAQATCLGSDYVQAYGISIDQIIRNPDKYPPEQGYGAAAQLGLPTDGWGIAQVLEEDYNWTEEEIRGLLGVNLIRIYDANWN